jgi:hypothetical protein
MRDRNQRWETVDSNLVMYHARLKGNPRALSLQRAYVQDLSMADIIVKNMWCVDPEPRYVCGHLHQR